MASIFTTVAFLFAVGILFFIPGFFLFRLFFRTSGNFIPFEAFLFSFVIGVGFLDFLMLFLGKIGVRFERLSLSLGIFSALALISLLVWESRLLWRRFRKESKESSEKKVSTPTFHFSKHQILLCLILLTLTVGIKTVYLSHAVLPTSTDLGHHMYWSKLIAETGKLPFYGKQEITLLENDVYELSADPKPIADFIIGEHLPFAAINIFSRADFFSAFPVVFLFLINLLSVLALFVFAYRLASDIKSRFLKNTVFTPQNIALGAMLFFGPLYTLASPQAKFVSGGVVGNTFGNLFIPLILLSYFRALKEKDSRFLALGFFLTFTLAYIHHLSTFVLIFILVFSFLLYFLSHFNNLGAVIRSWKKIFIAPLPITIAFLACIFFFSVAIPTYIEPSAIDTAIGTPTKATRTGLSFLQITFSSGEARVALGLAGIALLLALSSRFRYSTTFLVGWGAVLLIMTLHPEWLFIDIPSNRIGAYLSFPLGLLASFAFIALFALFLKSGSQEKGGGLFIPPVIVLGIAFSVFVFASGSGSFDNSQTLLPESKTSGALQTFAATSYMKEHSGAEDVILKDHNYIVADAWMKLFFLRDYAYPLSRGFFKRYEDNPNREQCTLLMISTPNTPQGEKCYTETGTNFVMINPRFDSVQFEKSEKFSRIYVSDTIHIYKKK